MKITAKEVKEMLKKRYSQPEYEIFFEVSSTTGTLNNQTRYADAVAFNMFASREYKIIGFEIKVNRNDLLKELKEASKAEAIYKYCDEWYLVIANNILKETDEVPDNWGIMEINENSKIKTIKKSKRNQNVILDRTFIASILREKNRPFSKELAKKEKEIRETLNKEFSEKIEKEIERRIKYKNDPVIQLSSLIKEILKDNENFDDKFKFFINFDKKIIEKLLLLCNSERNLEEISEQVIREMEYYEKELENLQKIKKNLINFNKNNKS